MSAQSTKFRSRPVEGHFETWVDDIVELALGKGPTSFSELLGLLPGIYPEDVLCALRRLEDRHHALNGMPRCLANSAAVEIAIPPAPSGLLGLPPPHPLDFEWRFSPDSIRSIASLISEVGPRNGALALVSTSTLAVSPLAVPRGMTADYFGIDAPLLASVGIGPSIKKVVAVDLLRLPSILERYDIVVMDPPWYEEHVHRFMYFAASILQVGGRLVLAMAPLGTRPGVERENRRVVDWADQLGLQLEEILAAALPYETPPFERSALRAAGILNVEGEWRRGDLWILRKKSDSLPAWPGDIVSNAWEEISFGPVRLRIDTAALQTSVNPELRPLVQGDVLQSVSRRDPRRTQVRVWTTCNRIFGCDAPVELANALKSLQLRQQPHLEESSIDRQLQVQLLELVDRECQELKWPRRGGAYFPPR